MKTPPQKKTVEFIESLRPESMSVRDGGELERMRDSIQKLETLCLTLVGMLHREHVVDEDSLNDFQSTIDV